MKRLALLIAVMAVISVATWAYNVNYKTRLAFSHLDNLRADMVAEQEILQVLRVEWAWLNAPDRLQTLVELHRDDLRLTRLEAERFSFVSTVPFPPTVTLDQRTLAELANISGATDQELEALDEVKSLWAPLPPIRPVGWSRQ